MEKCRLKAFGRVDLDGTHRAVVESSTGIHGEGSSNAKYIKISNNGKSCGCILSEVKAGKADRIYLDRFKQWHLGVRDDDEIEIEEFEPPSAEKVKLQIPTESAERYIARMVGKPITKGEKTAFFTFRGDPISVSTASTKPAGIVVIDSTTDVETTDIDAVEVPVGYKDIGGLSNEIKQIREVVEYPLRFQEVFEYLGVSQPRGLILFGPPGTGKTLIAKALANEVGARFFPISGPEMFSMWYGESEKKLRAIFDEARSNAPAVILIDEVDALTPKRESAKGELEQRIVATLLTLMDGLKQLKGVVVVGTTNRINSIDLALRREGRFGYEINIGVPNADDRREILDIHARRMPLSPDVELGAVADRSLGFVGADLAALCREAAYNALRRSFSANDFDKGQIVPFEGLTIVQADFETALQNIPPSAMKEFQVEIPRITWDDIGGLEEVKRLLIENVVYAITKREVFEKVGVKPARGILLYGLPGTGKTLLAKAVASQCQANFISVKGPEVRSKWVGESEDRIRSLFAKAREVAPCVIFFDEIDAIASARGKDSSGVTDTIVNQILSEMDGIESVEGVFVIGATNRHELLDPAILRPGRFDFHIEVPLPDKETRKAILQVHLKGKPLAQDVELARIVEFTDGLSGAEIAEVCREAIWNSIRAADFDADKVVVTVSQLKNSLNHIHLNKSKLKPRGIGFIRKEDTEETADGDSN